VFWRAKALGEALRLVTVLRSELDAQRTHFEEILKQSNQREKDLLDRLLQFAPAPPPRVETPPVDPERLAKRGPGRINFPGYRTLHRPPVPVAEAGGSE